MDRNLWWGVRKAVGSLVALRKESVDRNPTLFGVVSCPLLSLSARRAWIEIPAGCWRDARRASLSARRAWIEIRCLPVLVFTNSVALRKESVDRNRPQTVLYIRVLGRSPQGERG